MDSSLIEWLPYVDTQISDADYASAKALIEKEVQAGSSNTAHPSMRTAPEFQSSMIIKELIERASRGEKIAAVDMARYESGALEPPSSSPEDPDHLQEWKGALDRAATLYSYLGIRGDHLALLETYGKNAWLIGNDRAETELKALEKALAEAKEQLEQAEAQRRYNQEASKAEFDALQQEWRRRVVGKTQAEIATAEINEQIAYLTTG